jgi:hypothetical protein
MKYIFTILICLASLSCFSQDNIMMLGATEKEVIDYRKSIGTPLIKIDKDSVIMTFFYMPSDKTKMADIYYINKGICVAYSEFYYNKKYTRKSLYLRFDTNYKIIKKKSLWTNDNINIYLHKNKKIIHVGYLPTKKYLAKRMLSNVEI